MCRNLNIRLQICSKFEWFVINVMFEWFVINVIDYLYEKNL